MKKRKIQKSITNISDSLAWFITKLTGALLMLSGIGFILNTLIGPWSKNGYTYGEIIFFCCVGILFTILGRELFQVKN